MSEKKSVWNVFSENKPLGYLFIVLATFILCFGLYLGYTIIIGPFKLSLPETVEIEPEILDSISPKINKEGKPQIDSIPSKTYQKPILPQEYTITGTVKNDKGAPLEGAVVKFGRYGDTRTDKSGHFELYLKEKVPIKGENIEIYFYHPDYKSNSVPRTFYPNDTYNLFFDYEE